MLKANNITKLRNRIRNYFMGKLSDFAFISLFQKKRYNNKEITKIVYDIFKQKLSTIGFKQFRPGKYFYKTDYGYVTLDLQKSQFSLLFYINFGVSIDNTLGRKLIKEISNDLFYSHGLHTRISSKAKELGDYDILSFGNFQERYTIEENKIELLLERYVLPECKKVLSKDILTTSLQNQTHPFYEIYKTRFESNF